VRIRPALIASRHATRYLWIKQSRGGNERKGDGDYNPRYARARAICYFALSVTHSLIKRPPHVARPRHFSSPRQHTTCCDWRPLYFTLFFHLRFWAFFCPVIHPRCTNASRRPDESENDGISSKVFRLSRNSLWGKFASLQCEMQILFYKGMSFNIESECLSDVYFATAYKKSKFPIHNRSVSERLQEWTLFPTFALPRYL